MIRLNLHCRVGDETLGTIAAEQAPRVGDLLGYHPGTWSPYHGQHTWRVDAVVWNVAMPASPWALEQIRAGRGHELGQDGTVYDVNVLLWPVLGPYWPEEGDSDG